MRLPLGSLAIAASLAALFLFPGCDGGSGTTTPPSGATPSPTPSVDIAASPTGVDATVIDLATASPVTVIYAAGKSDLESDQPGLAAGDFNDDGLDDLLVGARFADPDGREDAGAAYIITGSRSPAKSVDLAAQEQDMTIIGARPGDNLGFSAAAADVNGDGIDDMVLGAFAAGAPDDPSTRPGAVYVLFGRNDLPDSLDL